MDEKELRSKSRLKHPELPVPEVLDSQSADGVVDEGDGDSEDERRSHSSVDSSVARIQEVWEKQSTNSDPDKQVVAKLQEKARKTKKVSTEDAISWVEDQLHGLRLVQEEDTIAREYEQLQAEMELLEGHIGDDPDQEEHEVVSIMNDSQRTRDTVMKQHFKGNKIEKLRDKFK